VAETCTENMIRRHDALERRFNDLLRRGGDDVEMELVAFSEIVERPRKQRNVVLQANALARFDEMFPAHFSKIRIVQNQIAEFRALLDEVHLGKAFHLVVKSMKADQFAKDDSRVVE